MRSVQARAADNSFRISTEFGIITCHRADGTWQDTRRVPAADAGALQALTGLL